LRLQSSNEESCKQLKQQISNCSSQNRGISSKESHLFGEGSEGEERNKRVTKAARLTKEFNLSAKFALV